MLITLCMVITLLPMTVQAAGSKTLTELYIGSDMSVTLPTTDGYYTYGADEVATK